MANSTMNVLAGAVSRPLTAAITSENMYRRYMSSVTSETMICGRRDTVAKGITYQIGRRHATAVECLNSPPSGVPHIDAAYPTGDVISATFSTLARKYSNFSGFFDFSNMLGVVERIAKGLAVASCYRGGCSASDLLGDQDLRINSLQVYFAPMSASRDTVFIPRVVDTLIAPDIFSVLTHAVCGEGGTVATDCLEVDATTRTPIMYDVDGYAFAPAAVEALRLLGANMSASGAGDLFALGVTRGLHSVLTVVSHTDEGGVIRDVLRCGGVAPPFGGVHAGLSVYTGLPSLCTSSGEAVAGYCDALLLATAALVAHCDPGITYNGAWLPTVILAKRGAFEEGPAGAHQAATNANGQENLRGLVQHGTLFADMYGSALAKLFCLDTGSGRAGRFLSACIPLVNTNSRHLSHSSMAPFFWIEPTSLIPHDFTGNAVEAEGFASFCSRGDRRALPAWEETTPYGHGDDHTSTHVVRFRGARCNALLQHLNQHPDGGMAYITPRQMDSEGVIHPGPGVNIAVTHALNGGIPISGYLWTRGQSPFCAPAEFINLGETMALRISHQTYNADGTITLNPVPQAWEFTGGSVIFSCSTPVGLPPGELSQEPGGARRARTRAARALATATDRARARGEATVEDVPISFTAPAVLRHRPAGIEMGPYPATGRGAAPKVRAEPISGNEPNDRDRVDGEALPAVMSHGTLAGPRLDHIPKLADTSGPTDVPYLVGKPSGARVEVHRAPPMPLPSPSAAPPERADQQ